MPNRKNMKYAGNGQYAATIGTRYIVYFHHAIMHEKPNITAKSATRHIVAAAMVYAR